MNPLDPALSLFAPLSVALIALACAVAILRSAFAMALSLGAFGLMAATALLALGAPDLAFAAALLGGVAALLFLATGLLTRPAAPIGRLRLSSLAAIGALGAALLFATPSLPAFGDRDSPANSGAGRLYINRSAQEIGAANAFTAVQAGYRAFDGFGQAAALFAAAAAAFALLGAGERGIAARNRLPVAPDSEEAG